MRPLKTKEKQREKINKLNVNYYKYGMCPVL